MMVSNINIIQNEWIPSRLSRKYCFISNIFVSSKQPNLVAMFLFILYIRCIMFIKAFEITNLFLSICNLKKISTGTLPWRLGCKILLQVLAIYLSCRCCNLNICISFWWKCHKKSKIERCVKCKYMFKKYSHFSWYVDTSRISWYDFINAFNIKKQFI